MKKNIIIVGIGKRTRDDMLPAILASGLFNIVGIYARSSRKIDFNGVEYQVNKLEDLDNQTLKKSDWLYLSVPISSSGSVLKQLNTMSISQINLLIDTPVFPIKYFGLNKYLNKFKKVCVSEDIIYLPWIKPLNNKIGGKFTKIVFDQSVYAYHGIALVKALINEDTFKSVGMKSDGDKIIIEIESKNGVLVTIVDPRDYSRGSMTFYGPGGEISDGRFSKGMTMKPIIENNLCTGLDISGEVVSFSHAESEVVGNVPTDSTLTSMTLKLKRIGMIKMLNEIVVDGNEGWTAKKAISDIRLYELVTHFGKYINIAKILNIFY